MGMDKTISIKEKQLIFVNVPVVVSSSLHGAINIEKILRFYEKIFAYHYMKELIQISKKPTSQIVAQLTRFYNIFVPLTFMIGIGSALYLLYKNKANIENIYPYLKAGKISPLLEHTILLEQKGDVELTRISIGDNIFMTFIAHITNRENISPKEILIASFKRNDVPLFQKDVEYFSDSETRVIQLAFPHLTYITTIVEYDELKQKYGKMRANFVLLDFSSNEVQILLLNNTESYIKYVTTIGEVLEKPQSNDVNINQLLNTLKGVVKE